LFALLVRQDCRRHPDIAVYLSLGMLLERDLINGNGMIGSTATEYKKKKLYAYYIKKDLFGKIIFAAHTNYIEE
jgi:hypothetical protein